MYGNLTFDEFDPEISAVFLTADPIYAAGI